MLVGRAVNVAAVGIVVIGRGIVVALKQQGGFSDRVWVEFASPETTKRILRQSLHKIC